MIVQEFSATDAALVFLDSTSTINGTETASPAVTGTVSAAQTPALAISFATHRDEVLATDAWLYGEDASVFTDSEFGVVGMSTTYHVVETVGNVSNSFSWETGDNGVSSGILLFDIQPN